MKNIDKAWLILTAILVVLCMSNDVQAQKTDVVVLINGNSVTGEIKSLKFSDLSFSTDSMGTVDIEWQEIVSLTSDQSLQVEVASGTRYFGNLVPASEEGMIAVGRGENIQELAISHVVRITPIETDEKIWQRLEGTVNFGFSSDKASEVTSSNLNANVRYRARTYLIGLDISSSITDQPGAATTSNQNIGMNYQRFKRNRWFTDWSASAEQNDAQGVDLRLSLGGGLGRYFVQNNNNQFSVLGGLVATRESFVDADPEDPSTESKPDATNGEGKIEIKYLHRASEPSSDIIFTTNYYPLLKDLTSFRSDSNLTLRREIIDDFYLDLSVYYTYLSDPPAGAEKDDYGVITSIGYSF